LLQAGRAGFQHQRAAFPRDACGCSQQHGLSSADSPTHRHDPAMAGDGRGNQFTDCGELVIAFHQGHLA